MPLRQPSDDRFQVATISRRGRNLVPEELIELLLAWRSSEKLQRDGVGDRLATPERRFGRRLFFG